MITRSWMKILFLALALAVFSTPAYAGLIKVEGNPGLIGSLGDANPRTVEAWLKGLLRHNDVWHYGRATPKDIIFRYDGGPDYSSKNFEWVYSEWVYSIDPVSEFVWTYAVVKHGGFFEAYEPEVDDGMLKVGLVEPLDYAIGYIDWFGGGAAAVPVPASALLLCSGLVGLALMGFRRRKK